ncbi:hypothetical protein [Streptomyces apocyni]|uniref:hypothetical protein n=1 Tax=Streptomyces apocyni TaxID=2654677 RepID=UPI0012EA2885|nr:hypothetical protein [Streptomyces apocyni]
MIVIPQGRSRRRALVSAVCAGLVAGITGLAGCSSPPPPPDPDKGTNGIGKLSATKIQSRSLKAAAAADSVRLSGSLVSKGQTYKLEMALTGDGGSGEVTSQDRMFHLLRIGKQLFLKADAAFWTRGGEDGKSGGAGVSDKLDGKYVKVPQGDPAYQQLSGFTDKDKLLKGLLTLHGKLATGERSEVAGQRAIRISGDAGAGGTLAVSLEGTPYPLLMERAGGAGSLRLTDWGKDVALEEPDKDETVDYGQQLPTS